MWRAGVIHRYMCEFLFRLVGLLSLSSIQCGSLIIRSTTTSPTLCNWGVLMRSIRRMAHNFPRLALAAVCVCVSVAYTQTVGARWAECVAFMQLLLLSLVGLSSDDLCGIRQTCALHEASRAAVATRNGECSEMAGRSVLCAQLAPNRVCAADKPKKTELSHNQCARPPVHPFRRGALVP